MGSSAMERERLETFEVGPCKDAFELGLLIGQRFSQQIRSRLASDLILQNQLQPFAHSPQSESLLKTLFDNNRTKFPKYWDELLGTAQGSGVPLLDILLINFRKEILAFIPKEGAKSLFDVDASDDCSDVLVVGESMAVVAHNEDANVALVGHTYLIKGILPDGVFFVGYTYAGELPSCAFGFNSHGLAFTLDSVPPAEGEIVAGGIGRNFISRDILEATGIHDAINRIHSSEVSVGHSYNLIETSTRRIVNVETASRKRISVHEVGKTPFFHANMYLHLQINQVQDKNSINRQKRADVLKKISKDDFLSLLGDTDDKEYPIYMTGPLLHTLCTSVIDLDEQTLSIIQGNPKKGEAFTLDSVPPAEDEIVGGGIGCNFISRDILEATGIHDAINRIHSSEVSLGHSYNLIETSTRRIVNVETASRKRISVHEVGKTPFFHANMYLHLQINQVQDKNSISRQKRADVLKKISKEDFLSLLGDTDDKEYPIYMTGPLLYTLCTSVIDLDEQTLSIIQGNPKQGEVTHVFSLSPNKQKNCHNNHSRAA